MMPSRGLLWFPEQQEHSCGSELLLQGQPPQGDWYVYVQLQLLCVLSSRWFSYEEVRGRMWIAMWLWLLDAMLEIWTSRRRCTLAVSLAQALNFQRQRRRSSEGWDEKWGIERRLTWRERQRLFYVRSSPPTRRLDLAASLIPSLITTSLGEKNNATITK